MTTQQELEAFVARISYSAELLFERDGRLSPTFFATVGDEIHVLAAPPFRMTVIYDIMIAMLKDSGAEQYAFVDEAWSVSGPLAEDFKNVDPSTDPRRTESVLIVAGDVEGHCVAGARAIIRKEGERPRLGDLQLAVNPAVGGGFGGSSGYLHLLADKPTTRH